MKKTRTTKKIQVDDLFKIDLTNLRKLNMIVHRQENTLSISKPQLFSILPKKIQFDIQFDLDIQQMGLVMLDDSKEKKLVCKQVISLTKTQCLFGGNRYWFLCPGRRDDRACNSRVRILYLASNNLGCRSCLDLAYYSSNIPSWIRRSSIFGLNLERRIDKLSTSMKRATYRKRPTKKLRAIEKLEERLKANGTSRDATSVFDSQNLN